MSKIHLLPKEERFPFFHETFVETKIPFEIVEKDFWVVWTLKKLFELPDLQSHLTFKGGTSLSKVYRIIQRFSEDIDVSIEKDFFGFDENSDPEKAASKKKQRAAIESLGQSCSDYVQNKMLTDLKSSIAAELGTEEGWKLLVDPYDPDGQTLQFEYPNITPRGGYIQQSVKIEMGARSEHWPVSERKIQSYAKEVLKEKVIEDEVTVRVLNSERTFWEKATILHQYAHLPEAKTLPPRTSRHLYDFHCLLNSATKAIAVANHELLDRVAEHKSIYFASAWANYGTAHKGTLKLSPPERIRTALEEDFKQMKQMFFGEIPDWKLILKTIEKFEKEFNSVAI